MIALIIYIVIIFLLVHFLGKTSSEKIDGGSSIPPLVPINNQISEQQEKPHFVAYSKKRSLLTNSERIFHSTLRKILQGDYLLFSQIGMLGIFDIKRIYDKKEYFFYLHKIQAKRIDFLICDSMTTEPILAIELDDWTHTREDRIKRDDYIDQVFKDANLPLLHIYKFVESEDSLVEKLRPYLPGLKKGFTQEKNNQH